MAPRKKRKRVSKFQDTGLITNVHPKIDRWRLSCHPSFLETLYFFLNAFLVATYEIENASILSSA